MLKKMLFLILIIYIPSTIYSYEGVLVKKLDYNLPNSSNYKLEGALSRNLPKAVVANDKVIGGAVSETISFEDIINFNFGNPTDFVEENTGNFSYNGPGKKDFLIIPITKISNNNNNIVRGNFSLEERVENQNNDIISVKYFDKDFYLPDSNLKLREVPFNNGNKFSYGFDKNIEKEHLSLFKKQKYLLRITKGAPSLKFNVYNKNNPVQLAGSISKRTNNENIIDFLEGNLQYVDFILDGDYRPFKTESSTTYGVSVFFDEEGFTIFGLPNFQYSLDLYSLRYSSELDDRGNLVITEEDSISFRGKGFSNGESIKIIGFHSKNAPENIQISLVTASYLRNSELIIKEKLSKGNMREVLNLTIEEETIEKIYNRTTTELNEDGFDSISGLYYRKFLVSYKSPFQNYLNEPREIFFIYGNNENKVEYIPKPEIEIITDYPHQTLIAMFDPSKRWDDDFYVIEDREIKKESLAYKEINILNANSFEDILSNRYTGKVVLQQNLNNYLWQGANNGTEKNSIMIKKASSSTKGKIKKNQSNETIGTFYTAKGIKNFIYLEESNLNEIGDEATFSWEYEFYNGYLNEGEDVVGEEVVFRVVRLKEERNGEGNVTSIESPTDLITYNVGESEYSVNLPKYYFDPTTQSSPLKSAAYETNIDNFTRGSIDYLDLIFHVGADKIFENESVVFNYSRNNSLKILGLPRGKYLIQAYSLQGSDGISQKDIGYDYRILSYGGYKEFQIGLPKFVTGEFKNHNNFFMIESINYDERYDNINKRPFKRVFVNFVTKAERELDLKVNNLVAKLEEESDKKYTNNFLTEIKEGSEEILAGTNITLRKSAIRDFKYPLDIVFLIDNSGSMQPFINEVKNGLRGLSRRLDEKGFDVKYNLLTFGPTQTRSTMGEYWYGRSRSFNRGYAALFRGYSADPWFRDLEALRSGFNGIRANGGFNWGQENGAWAIKIGMDHLNTNGRFLDFENVIVNNSSKQEGFLPSTRWLILLTDENMDTQDLPREYNSSNIGYKIVDDLRKNQILMTGILFTDILTSNREWAEELVNKIPNSNYYFDSSRLQYRIDITDDLGNEGNQSRDTGDFFYSEMLAYKETDEEFLKFYDMGNRGEFIDSAIKDSEKQLSIIQRWTLSYNSPFFENDGLERKIIFSLEGIPQIDEYGNPLENEALEIKPIIKGKDRYYKVPESKIEAYFENPDVTSYQLRTKGKKIILKAKVRSQYRNDEGVLVNNPIVSASYTVSGERTEKFTFNLNDSTFKKREVYDELGYRWFEFEKEIEKDIFIEKFGDKDLTIEFVASNQKKESVQISASPVELIVQNDIEIKTISLKNNTLYNFLKEIEEYTDVEGNLVVTDLFIKNNSISVSTISEEAIDIKPLNVKDGDLIEVALEYQSDGEISTTRSSINLGGIEAEDITLVEIEGKKWINGLVKLTRTMSFNKNIVIDIVELEKEPGQNIIEISNILIKPPLIDSSDFLENTINEPNINFYNQKDVAVLERGEEVLLYLLPVSLDVKYSDKNGSDVNFLLNRNNNETLIPSTRPSFELADGLYNYSKIYVLNKSGAIKEVLDYNLETFFYDFDKSIVVDTVSPLVISSKIKKYSESSIKVKSILEKFNYPKGIIDENYYKNGDGVRYEIIFSEKNFNETFGLMINENNTLKKEDVNIKENEGFVTIYSTNDIIVDERNGNKDNIIFNIKDKAGNSSLGFISKGNYQSLSSGYLSIDGIFYSVEKPSVGDLKFVGFSNRTVSLLFNQNQISPVLATMAVKNGESVSNYYLNNSDFSNLEEYVNNGVPISSSFVDGEKELLSIGFTSSGAITENREDIVIDRNINYNESLLHIDVPYQYDGLYRVPIDFGLITEMVGLKEIQIIDSTEVTVEGRSGNRVNLFLKPGIKAKVTPEIFEYTEEPVFVFRHNTMSQKRIKVRLFDRLGNSKLINIVISVNPNIEVIGKSSKAENRKESSTVELKRENIEILNKTEK